MTEDDEPRRARALELIEKLARGEESGTEIRDGNRMTIRDARLKGEERRAKAEEEERRSTRTPAERSRRQAFVVASDRLSQRKPPAPPAVVGSPLRPLVSGSQWANEKGDSAASPPTPVLPVATTPPSERKYVGWRGGTSGAPGKPTAFAVALSRLQGQFPEILCVVDVPMVFWAEAETIEHSLLGAKFRGKHTVGLIDGVEIPYPINSLPAWKKDDRITLLDPTSTGSTSPSSSSASGSSEPPWVPIKVKVTEPTIQAVDQHIPANEFRIANAESLRQRLIECTGASSKIYAFFLIAYKRDSAHALVLLYDIDEKAGKTKAGENGGRPPGSI